MKTRNELALTILSGIFRRRYHVQTLWMLGVSFRYHSNCHHRWSLVDLDLCSGDAQTMRNIQSNHTGLSALNLYLHNMLVMNKYYWRERKTIEYSINWPNRIKQTIWATLFGWTPWHLRTEKQWNKAIDRRCSIKR